jgi:hypothetical protein
MNTTKLQLFIATLALFILGLTHSALADGFQSVRLTIPTDDAREPSAGGAPKTNAFGEFMILPE